MADLDSAVACTKPYSDIEEDFFRAGDEIGAGVQTEALDVELPKQRRRSLWARLFERPLRLPSETDDFVPAPAARTRPRTERPATEESDDEWDWRIALARARSRPATQPGL